MAITRTRKPNQDTDKQVAQIVWAIADEGDINETHAGGNATKTLQQRLQSRGVKLDSKDVYNRLSSMEKKGWITRVTKDKRCFAIRLNVEPEQSGVNPYKKRAVGRPAAKASQLAEFSIDKATHANSNGSSAHADLSIRERLDLAMDLLSSAKADLDRI